MKKVLLFSLLILLTNLFSNENEKKEYQKLCRLGLNSGCYDLAHYYSKVDRVKYHQEILDLYYLTCKNRYYKSCYNLALFLDEDKNRTKNLPNIVKLYTISCNEGNNSNGCYNLALLYAKEKKIEDNFKAVKFYKKACKGGVYEGCYNLGLMYANGKGVRQDYKKAKELFGKACDKGISAGCQNYAVLNKMGY